MEILESFTKHLPDRCIGIRNLMEYLLLELVSKLSMSIESALSSGNNFDDLHQNKALLIISNLKEIKTTLKCQFIIKPQCEKAELSKIEENEWTITIDSSSA